MAKKKDLASAEEIMTLAEKSGVKKAFLFRTTFDRYLVQLGVLTRLKKVIEESGELCEKEYVKGRKNLYVNPAITEYNRTATAANQTVNTLINIIKALTSEDEQEETIADVMGKLLGNDK